MSMICFPPITDTAVSLSTPAGRPANQIAPNIRSRLRQIETSIDFCICLKIKDRIDNTGRCQCVRKIQERERNHNKAVGGYSREKGIAKDTSNSAENKETRNPSKIEKNLRPPNSSPFCGNSR